MAEMWTQRFDPPVKIEPEQILSMSFREGAQVLYVDGVEAARAPCPECHGNPNYYWSPHDEATGTTMDVALPCRTCGGAPIP